LLINKRKTNLNTVEHFCSISFYLYAKIDDDSKILVLIIAINEEFIRI